MQVAELQACEIFDPLEGVLGHQMTDARGIGADELEPGILCGARHRFAHRPLQGLAQGRDVLEQERHVEDAEVVDVVAQDRSEEHTSELQSLMRISYAVFCLKKKNKSKQHRNRSKKV